MVKLKTRVPFQGPRSAWDMLGSITHVSKRQAPNYSKMTRDDFDFAAMEQEASTKMQSLARIKLTKRGVVSRCICAGKCQCASKEQR